MKSTKSKIIAAFIAAGLTSSRAIRANRHRRLIDDGGVCAAAQLSPIFPPSANL